tara:strand:+ start:40927 stop:41301 length:375 start_codon:yes stop_codon:yes gene_type:complete
MFKKIKQMKQMGSMMQNAQGMQEQMVEMQKEFDEQHFTRSYAEDKIEVIMTGALRVVETKIDPEYQSSISNEQLQKDITFAFDDLIAAISQHKAEKMQEITMSMFEGMDMEGIDMEEVKKQMNL